MNIIPQKYLKLTCASVIASISLAAQPAYAKPAHSDHAPAVIDGKVSYEKPDYAQTAKPLEEAKNSDRLYFTDKYSYSKPGSSIRYKYSVPKDVKIGQSIRINLSLSEPFQSGTLNVKTQSKGAVSISPQSAAHIFDMGSDNAHDMHIDVTVNGAGRHYVQVLTQSSQSSTGGPAFRNFSIPIQVGPKTKKLRNPNVKRGDDGQMVISMKANEEIK